MGKYKSTDKNVLMSTLSSYIFMVLYAILLNIVGEVLPSIIDEFNLTMAKASLLQMLFNLGGFVVLIWMLRFSDRIRKSRLVYYSFLITSITMVVFGLFTNSFLLLLIAFAILGSTTKVFDVSINAFVNDINTNGREFFLQMLHMTFGIGAVIGPVYASFIIKNNFGWRTSLWSLGLIYALFLLMSLFTIIKPSSKIETIESKNNRNRLNIRVLLKDPRIWILFIGAGCISGTYAGLITWFPAYAKSISAEIGALSALMLSTYFIGSVFSRATASFILNEKNARHMIILSSFFGGIMLLSAFIISQSWAFFLFFIIAGFFSGATLPMIISVTCVAFPYNSGGATTILYIGITIFAMIVPYIMGIIGDNVGLAKAMPLIAYLMLFAAGVSFMIQKPRI